MSNELEPWDGSLPAQSSTIPDRPFEIAPRVQSTLPMDEPKGLAMVARAINNPTGSLRSKINSELMVTGFTFFLRQISGSDEPLRHGLYILVHTADGAAYWTTSGGVRDAIPLLIAEWGKPPWKGGKAAIVMPVELEGGKLLLKLVAK